MEMCRGGDVREDDIGKEKEMNYWQLRREILMSIDQHVKDMGASITKARVSDQKELANELLNVSMVCESLTKDLLRYADLISYQRFVSELNGQPCPRTRR